MKITIPNPCSEDWQKMTATEKGQFCAVCQKCVVDFTTMTDVEIIRYLNIQKGETCGRFTKEQLNRPLTPPNRFKIPFSKWVLASTFSLSFMLPKEGFATVPMVQTQKTLADAQMKEPSLIVANNSFTDRLRIEGVVLDSLDKGVLIGVSIVIKGTNRGTVTDLDGKFGLDCPNEIVTLIVSYTGYKTKTVVFEPENSNMEINIELKAEDMLMGEYISTRRATLWQRTKRHFRKRNH